MLTEIDILKDISQRLEKAKISYMVTGSMAMNYYAQSINWDWQHTIRKSRMDDTSTHVKKEMKERMMHLSGVRRMKIGASMFDSARRMVLSSFSSEVDGEKIRENLFLRLYKDDFSSIEQKRIIQYLNIQS